MVRAVNRAALRRGKLWNTEGRRLFEDKVAIERKKREPVAAIAAKLGVSASTVYGLVDGTRQPSIEVAGDIERRYGIPARTWSETPLCDD
jgi:hypothetical protein